MESATRACALCGRAIDGAGPVHVVQGKTICEGCGRAVVALEPRVVLPYAEAGSRRRRRWVWPSVAAAAVVAVLLVSMLWTAQRAAMDRARAEQMRALAAEQRARAAAAARANAAATRPVISGRID